VRRLLIAAVCVLALGGASSAGSAESYKIVIYTTWATTDQGAVGHAYVQLRHGSTNMIYGKYPDGKWLFDTDGKIKDDGGRGWRLRMTWQVNADQFGLAKQYLNRQRERPDNYKLLSDNCVEFVVSVARAGGVTVPNYKGKVGQPDPEYLYDSMVSLKNRGEQFHGGVVDQNQSPGTAASAAHDPPPPSPPCCAVDAILDGAASYPGKLARELRLGYQRQYLPPGSLSGKKYGVVITNTDVRANLYAIRWGDGRITRSARPRATAPGQVSFYHRYRRPPRKPLSVVIVQNGRVLQYLQTVRTAGAGPNAQIDAEPAPPPETDF
jgi:hypothetical protein